VAVAHGAPVSHREGDAGEIASVVNATGTATPVLSVRVGSFASGPVVKLHEGADKTVDTRSATQRVRDRRETHKRHVWFVGEDGLLQAVTVIAGIGDTRYTEVVRVVSGELREGQDLITGLKK
jgi:hypothetical protein